MQVLEGAADDVHMIYNSILKDSRNTGNILLADEAISQRAFPNWSMGFKNLESVSPQELPGFQDVFAEKLDINIAANNPSKALDLLFKFAETP